MFGGMMAYSQLGFAFMYLGLRQDLRLKQELYDFKRKNDGFSSPGQELKLQNKDMMDQECQIKYQNGQEDNRISFLDRSKD